MTDQVNRPILRPCPTCFAPAGQPCSAPTVSGRRVVDWFHFRREEPWDIKEGE